MSYKDFLKNKSLEVHSLPKGLQKKIIELEKFNAEVLKLKESSSSLSEDNSLQEISESALKLDSYISRKIELFNSDAYAKKLKVIENMAEKKQRILNNKKEVLEVNIVNEENIDNIPKVNFEEKVNSIIGNPPIKITEKEKKVEIEEDKYINDIKSLVQEELENNFSDEIEEEDDNIEIDYSEENDFDKYKDSKPRKKSKAFILLGIGVFFLTFGAVYLYKETR